MFDQLAIDRITETENLTDNLDDDTADWLIKWGIEQAHKIIGKSQDKEVADVTINRIMAVMRKLNKIAGNIQSVSPDELRVFAESHASAFGTTVNFSDDQYTRLADEIRKLSPLDAIKTLIAFTSGKSQSSAKNDRSGCSSVLGLLFGTNRE
jgi:hypothetical protein